jgi:hypothetical protein
VVLSLASWGTSFCCNFQFCTSISFTILNHESSTAWGSTTHASFLHLVIDSTPHALILSPLNMDPFNRDLDRDIILIRPDGHVVHVRPVTWPVQFCASLDCPNSTGRCICSSPKRAGGEQVALSDCPQYAASFDGASTTPPADSPLRLSSMRSLLCASLCGLTSQILPLNVNVQTSQAIKPRSQTQKPWLLQVR